jgi:hypothetical protein
MSAFKRVIGRSAIFNRDQMTGVDAEGLLHRILLFDQYVLSSVRLQEIPHLVKTFGFEGTRDLLESNLVQIKCESLAVAQSGQTTCLDAPVLPLYTYRIDLVDAHDRREYISRCLHQLHNPAALKHNQINKLKRTIVQAIRPLPDQFRSILGPACVREIQNTFLVRAAIDIYLVRKHGAYDVPYSLVLHDKGEGVFRAVSDLAAIAKISDVEAHKAIEAGLLAVAALAQTILEMNVYSAVSGFRDDELPLFQRKLGQVYEALTSEAEERQFTRVIELALPNLTLSNRVLDVDVLLKLKESSELREFRAWLENVGTWTDDEIKRVVASWRVKLGLFVGGSAGRTLRFLATSAGAIKNPAGALSVAILDQFIIDRLLPRTGIAASVNELYPSLFSPAK